MKEIIFENLKIQQGIDFGKLTTMKISGKAHFFTVVKNIEDFKNATKFSEKNNLKAQEVLQMYFFERFLARLEESKYRANFIIKGGFLISSIIGIQNRTTMDIDTTIKGLPVKEEIIKEIILEILNIEVNDGIEFVLGKIENIREISEYENYRLHLTANFEKIKNPLKIDITTGDVIIPSEIEYSYETIFKEKLNILAYSLETLIAEKYETIIKRNITTTRLRDFYDIYMIFKLKNDKIDVNNLKQAIWETAKNRNSMEEILESKEILEDIKNDEYLNKQWNIYKNENKYVDNIQFSEILKLLNKIADIVQE